MKRKLTRVFSIMLAVMMLLQMSDLGIAFAANAPDPAAGINLIVPEELQDGNNYFFIRESGQMISEKSTDKVYIPVQRTGNLDEEAEVTLKLVDLSARFGENYKAKILDDRVKPELVYGGEAVIDVIQNASDQTEVETVDENDFGENVYNAGGAELLDSYGNPVGTVTATPLDENGNPVEKEEQAAAADADAVETAAGSAAKADGSIADSLSAEADAMASGGSETTMYEPDENTGTDALRGARDAFTGTVSDRQEMASSEDFLSQMTGGMIGDVVQEGADQEEIDLVKDDYPGREFLLHFNAGEEAKYLVITPKYSGKADGNCDVMAMLMNPSENTPVHQGYYMTNVTIQDEDAPEPVIVSMATEQVTAKDGRASITVTREGRINTIVGVRLTSWDGTAEVNTDYGGVDANLYFAMGITERTIELPVGEGVREKDFHVSITPVTDCEIGLASTQVVIPASEAVKEAELMADDDNLYGEDYDLRHNNRGYSSWFSDYAWLSDYAIHFKTREDELDIHNIYITESNNYAWDGIHMDYDLHTWYAKANVNINKVATDYYKTLINKDWGDCSWKRNQTMDAYYGAESGAGPGYGSGRANIVIKLECYEVHNIFRDSYTEININRVRQIRRKFNISVENPESLDFIGMDPLPEGVLNPYQKFKVNGTDDKSFSILTEGSFNVSAVNNVETPQYTRLVGVEAVKDGGSMRVASIGKESDVVNVTLSEDMIEKLQEGGFITWKPVGDNGSYEGSIRFRPVFEYIDITVEVLDNQNGHFKAANLEPGTHTFHLGDKLPLETSMSAAGRLARLQPSGFAYTAKTDKNGTITIPHSERDYVNGSGQLLLTQPYYELEPTFTETDNQVVVKVSKDDLDYFDQTKGLFTSEQKWTSGSYWCFKVASDVLSNEVVEMQAFPKEETFVPVWKTTRDSLTYSGQTFYIRTGTRASENEVTLTADRTASDHAYYSVSGSVYVTSMNLSTGWTITSEDVEENADPAIMLSPAEGAMVNVGTAGTLTDESGGFTMVPVYLAGGTTLRYAVTYNGMINLREVKLPAADAKKQAVTYDDPANPGTQASVDAVFVSANKVDVDAYTADNVHFGKVYAVQEGQISGGSNLVRMSGSKTVFTVYVEEGQPYYFDGDGYMENVTDVAMFFKNPFNGDVHGRYFASEKDSKLKWDAAAGTATLTFDKFAPDTPEEYEVGDVLYVQLFTDKKVDGNTLYLENEIGMIYNPVSTGITVTSDLNYEPETMEYEMPLSAESLFGVQQSDTRATYGTFPFMGEITFAVQLLSPIKNWVSDSDVNRIMADLDDDESGYADDADEEYNPSGYSRSQWNFNIAVKIKETAYGGTRFMFAIVADIGGGGNAYKSMTNPYDTKDRFDSVIEAPLTTDEKWEMQAQGAKLNDIKFDRMNDAVKRASAGGPYYMFQFFFGFYMDWGYVEITNTDGSTGISHDLVFMGAGGFFGANATVGATAYTWLIVVPAYLNFEGTADMTAFLGKGADPVKTLDMYAGEKHHDYGTGTGWDFTIDVVMNAQAGITFGVGLYKVAGIRASGGIGAEVDLSNKIPQWYPNLDMPYGYGTNFFCSGTIDLVFVSIPLWSYSWDGPFGGGFVKYFRQVRMGNTLIPLVNQGIRDGDGSPEAREECRKKVENLQTRIDNMDSSPDELKSLVSDLRSYAWHHDVINYEEYDRSKMNSTGGIFGAIGDAIMMEDGETQGVPMSGDTSSAYFVRDHVDSDWVADSGELMSGYGPVSSQTLMEDAYVQPNSQIISIGRNKMLMVFLDDRGSGDKTQSAVLKYTIYDTKKDTWTTPEVVQNDSTGDSKPNLIDADGKLILSWASTTDEKYAALKDTVAAELAAKNGTAPSDSEVEAALEADAARVMAQMDIFTVEFDKGSQTFDEIVQLTDDDMYDDYPQAVFDEETGDYIVMYTKTSQDTEEDYANEEEQALLDLVNPYANPKKTYSVLAYMLYNNQTDAADAAGNVHEAGWAVDYLFPNETSLDVNSQTAYLNRWKGQRFLDSSVKNDEGKTIVTDPPIVDLTTCEGYNGLAAYAYTVDMDQDVDTAEDKALYIQFYNFKDHLTYVPVRIAGEADRTQLVTPENKYESGYSYLTTKEPVDVGMPKMVRNGGSTWLFWREGSTDLKYLNVSELLNAQVRNEDETSMVYAVRADGTFAYDPSTEKIYEPKVQDVDIASAVTGEDLNITEYQVFTDAEDNLYVAYTDTTTYDAEDPVLDVTQTGMALEVYVTAKIKDPSVGKEWSSEDSPEVAFAASNSWSRPNRLTKDNAYNDGVAIALDEDGELFVLHNQYTIEDKRSDLDYLEAHGMITTDENGEEQIDGDPFVRSPISMVVTRCAEEGTVEVVDFDLSDMTPKNGDTVKVTAVLANNGLTSADGYMVEFYEYKDGKRGKKIAEQKSDEVMPVNSGRWVNFEWTVPSEGIEGYSIQAVTKEKKKGAAIGYYEESVMESWTFTQIPKFDIEFDSVQQNGDAFDIRYTVTNTGNKAAEEGTTASLKLKALHGDLKEVYGMDDSLLLKTDVSGLQPGETKTVSESVSIPISVFRHCGYDAVAVEVESQDHQLLGLTGAKTITLDEPMNLKLNGGNDIILAAEDTKTVDLTYDTTVFLETGKVIYSTDDNSVINVDENGNVTAVGSGTATLTATLVPSGRQTSINVRVAGDGEACPKDDTCPISKFSDAKPDAWYHDGVHWALEEGVMNGTADTTFEPNTAATRGMIVTMLWRMDGEAEVDQDVSFKDVESGRWYTKAVKWAVKNNITNGLSDTAFGPNDKVTREQFTTFLCRYAEYKGVDVSTGANADLSRFNDASTIAGWAVKSFSWAVAEGIITGMDPVTLSPKTDASRAQVATMFMRYDLLS